MSGQARPLRVWLVENNNPFAPTAGAEATLVKNGIRARLLQWFTRVVQHRDANAGRPAGYRAAVEVSWSAANSLGQVGDRDIVIYFSPSPFSTSPPANPPQTVHAGPYRTAAGQLTDAELRAGVLGAIGNSTSGGHTVRAARGNTRVPALSEVFVLYDRQLSNQQSRVQDNVETLATAAFHEAGHNKADRLHEDGGKGIFADVYTGQQPTAANFAFLARHIWDWGPQYIIGQPLTPVAPP